MWAVAWKITRSNSNTNATTECIRLIVIIGGAVHWTRRCIQLQFISIISIHKFNDATKSNIRNIQHLLVWHRPAKFRNRFDAYCFQSAWENCVYWLCVTANRVDYTPHFSFIASSLSIWRLNRFLNVPHLSDLNKRISIGALPCLFHLWFWINIANTFSEQHSANDFKTHCVMYVTLSSSYNLMWLHISQKNHEFSTNTVKRQKPNWHTRTHGTLGWRTHFAFHHPSSIVY